MGLVNLVIIRGWLQNGPQSGRKNASYISLFSIIPFSGHNADDIAETVIMNGKPFQDVLVTYFGSYFQNNTLFAKFTTYDWKRSFV